MKFVKAAALAAGLMAGALMPNANMNYKQDNLYNSVLFVTNVQHIGEYEWMIDARTFGGITYQFVTDAEDYEVNDIIAAMMDSKGTQIITDNAVIETHYAGWICGDEFDTWKNE